jgi:hypothetical protein
MKTVQRKHRNSRHKRAVLPKLSEDQFQLYVHKSEREISILATKERLKSKAHKSISNAIKEMEDKQEEPPTPRFETPLQTQDRDQDMADPSQPHSKKKIHRGPSKEWKKGKEDRGLLRSQIADYQVSITRVEEELGAYQRNSQLQKDAILAMDKEYYQKQIERTLLELRSWTEEAMKGRDAAIKADRMLKSHSPWKNRDGVTDYNYRPMEEQWEETIQKAFDLLPREE